MSETLKERSYFNGRDTVLVPVGAVEWGIQKFKNIDVVGIPDGGLKIITRTEAEKLVKSGEFKPWENDEHCSFHGCRVHSPHEAVTSPCDYGDMKPEDCPCGHGPHKEWDTSRGIE